MNYYNICISTYHNNIKIGCRYANCLTKDYKENYTEELTWNNLHYKYKQNGSLYFFDIWNFKKGRRISFFDGGKYHKDIKEWKEPKLNITIKWEYRLTVPSIDTILQWHNGEDAIQYLIERGINILEKTLDRM